jgi:hypothetical protein
MPPVRTEMRPMSSARITAMAMESGIAAHHGQSRPRWALFTPITAIM